MVIVMEYLLNIMKHTMKYNKNNERHGVYETYHSNGQLQNVGRHENGEMVGIWKTFSRDGFLLSEKNIKIIFP